MSNLLVTNVSREKEKNTLILRVCLAHVDSFFPGSQNVSWMNRTILATRSTSIKSKNYKTAGQLQSMIFAEMQVTSVAVNDLQRCKSVASMICSNAGQLQSVNDLQQCRSVSVNDLQRCRSVAVHDLQRCRSIAVHDLQRCRSVAVNDLQPCRSVAVDE